jgi:hypothetical protein
MYSRMSLRHSWQLEAEVDHAAYSRALASAREMLGSAKHVRFAKHVFDIATGRKVAGRYVNGLIQISLLAKNVERETKHECFHFAVDHLFSQQEIGIVRAQFAPGTELNWRVRDLLVKAGEYDAAAQCDDPEEAAAHAFTMWEAGELSVAERPVQRLFGDLVSVVKDAVRWFRRTVLDQKCTTVEELFDALASGDMAGRAGAKRAHAEAAAHESASEAMRYIHAEPQRP